VQQQQREEETRADWMQSCRRSMANEQRTQTLLQRNERGTSAMQAWDDGPALPGACADSKNCRYLVSIILTTVLYSSYLRLLITFVIDENISIQSMGTNSIHRGGFLQTYVVKNFVKDGLVTVEIVLLPLFM